MKSLHIFLFQAICQMPLLAADHPPHPRLLVTESDWKNLPARMKAQPEVAAVIEACMARADQTLGARNLTYELTGRRMLSVSREAVERVLDLSAAWRVTGDRRYFERCRSELLSLCAFKDWHPPHHLDTAEMQAAVAIGYDWLYADLSEADRKTISTALLDKGLKTTFADKRVVRRDNNWNQVCNGGMVLSAVALLDVAPELALSALEDARAGIPIGLQAGYPTDGAYSEGPGYWDYGTIYSILTAEALRTAQLPGAGITEHPGFLESGKYIALAYGNSGLMFNYGDNRQSTRNASASIAWMAKRNQSAAIWDDFGDSFLKIDPKRAERFLALAAFWIPDPEELRDEALPLHFVGTGKSPIAIHRIGFGEKDLFLGVKAGKANVNHGHMDAGSFVLDSLGHRWVSDLGHQDYHSLEQTGMNLFEMTPQSRRWTVFRLNQSSHNTLTYNGRPHDINGAAKILSSTGAPGNETILDMSAPLGLPEGAAAQRSFMIAPDGIVTVTDTLTGLRRGDAIDWHMITRAKVKPTTAGYLLSLGNEKLDLMLSSAQASGISAGDADPPPSRFDEKNPGVMRIHYRAKAGHNGEIVIRAVFQRRN
jgi:oligo-alginate lyase